MEQFETDISVKSLNSETGRGATNIKKMTGGHIATLIVLTISGFVIPRILGAEKFGLYAAVIAVITIMQAVSSLGLNQVAMRYLGPTWVLQKKTEAINLGSSILATRMILSVIAGIIATFLLYFSAKLELTFFICALIGGLCVLRSAFTTTRIFFLPLGHPGKMAGFEVIRVSLTLLVVILFFIWFGLSGVFISLPILSAVLLIVCVILLLRIIPLRLNAVSWAALRPFIRFSVLTYIGSVSVVFHTRFSIYYVASFVTQQEAAFLAIAVNLYIIVLDLINSAGSSLIPIMAEMEDLDQFKRLGYWGSLIMRYSAAFTVIIVVGWVLMGKNLIRWFLTDTFLPVYPAASLILISAIFVSSAGACNAILLIKNMAGIASANRMIFGLVTIFGLIIVVNRQSSNISHSIAWVYVIASLIFWGCSYITLGFFGKIWLPLQRTLLLILPVVFLVWVVHDWIISFWIKLVAFCVFLIVYGFIAISLRLLPFTEVKEIFITFVRQGLKTNKKI